MRSEVARRRPRWVSLPLCLTSYLSWVSLSFCSPPHVAPSPYLGPSLCSSLYLSLSLTTLCIPTSSSHSFDVRKKDKCDMIISPTNPLPASNHHQS